MSDKKNLSGHHYERIRKALAMAPTPGPWVQDGDVVSAADEDVAVAMCCPSDAEAAFIAACDPDTIRSLLAERDELAEQLRLATIELALAEAEIELALAEAEANDDALAKAEGRSDG